MNKITVIDSPMVSGKSSFAIQYMNDNKDKVFVYVTPLLSEVDRIVNSVEGVFDCNSIKETKLSVLREHLDNGRSVAKSVALVIIHTKLIVQ